MEKITKTFVDGQPLTAADLNSIKNGVNALYGDERPEVTDADYYEMVDVNGNPVKVTKASAASMIAEVIRTTPDLQAKVTFGAVDAAGLSSVVAQQMGNPLPIKGSRSNVNIDNILDAGVYSILRVTDGTFPSSFTSYGILEVIVLSGGTSTWTFQRFTNVEMNVFIRVTDGGASAWGEWKQSGFNVTSAANLASVVAGQMSIVKESFTGTSYTTKNLAGKYGLCVITTADNASTHLCLLGWGTATIIYPSNPLLTITRTRNENITITGAPNADARYVNNVIAIG